jgi:drug/metabolite transporter (DMT)-like permease
LLSLQLGSQVLCFQAARWTQAAEIAVVDYTWPLLVVLAAPLVLRDAPWRLRALVAATVGFGASAWLLWRTGSEVGADVAASGWLAAAESALV